MYKSSRDTGYCPADYHRFNSLKHITFQTILDYGSGCCMLFEWLKRSGLKFEYVAYDRREDALSLCECPTYTNIPNMLFDVVCLFGTYDHVKSTPIEEWKNTYLETIRQAKEYSRKHLIFTGIKDTIPWYTDWGRFSKQELISFCEQLNLKILMIDEETEPTEYIFICEI